LELDPVGRNSLDAFEARKAAEFVSALCEPVIDEPFSPKLMPFPLAKTSDERAALDPPAEILIAPPPPPLNEADAVTVEPFKPKLTLWELPNARRASVPLEPPAETLKAPAPPVPAGPGGPVGSEI